jgi:hypothetical protein
VLLENAAAGTLHKLFHDWKETFYTFCRHEEVVKQFYAPAVTIQSDNNLNHYMGPQFSLSSKDEGSCIFLLF